MSGLKQLTPISAKVLNFNIDSDLNMGAFQILVNHIKEATAAHGIVFDSQIYTSEAIGRLRQTADDGILQIGAGKSANANPVINFYGTTYTSGAAPAGSADFYFPDTAGTTYVLLLRMTGHLDQPYLDLKSHKMVDCQNNVPTTSGTYTGDGNQNRAITHDLGVTPKEYMIYTPLEDIYANRRYFVSALDWAFIEHSIAGGALITNRATVTSGDSTYFYVGAGAGKYGNFTNKSYSWVAWG